MQSALAPPSSSEYELHDVPLTTNSLVMARDSTENIEPSDISQ